MKKLWGILLVALVIGVITVGAGWGAIPQTIGFQGYLTQGGKAQSGTQTVGFKIYPSLTGGTATKDLGNKSITVDPSGFFDVELDMTGVTFNNPYWVEVTFPAGATTPMTPRQPLRSVPYALNTASENWTKTDTTLSYIDGNVYVKNNFAADGNGSFNGSLNAGKGLTAGGDIVGSKTMVANGNIISVGNLIGKGLISQDLVQVWRDEAAPATDTFLKSYIGGTPYAARLESNVSHGIVFNTGGKDSMIIDGAGNVGIGTSSPGTKLDVNGGGAFTSLQSYGFMASDAVSASNVMQVSGGTGADQFINFRQGGDSTKGRVGRAGVILSSFSANHYFLYNDGALKLSYSNENKDNPIWSQATDIITVKTDGNVGIGTTTPQTKLEVNGAVSANSIKFPESPWKLKMFDKYAGILDSNGDMLVPCPELKGKTVISITGMLNKKDKPGIWENLAYVKLGGPDGSYVSREPKFTFTQSTGDINVDAVADEYAGASLQLLIIYRE